MSRQAVLVLGMHRSGTSVLAGLLGRLGAQTPRALMSPDANNPQGYWESRLFHDFHERLLVTAATRWDSWTQIPSEWFRSEASARLHEECLSLLQTEFGDASLFVLKDPRMCRLMPFWIPAVTAAGISASAVLVVRNPHDVARSLEHRNAMPRTTALLIWLRHVLEAESDSRMIRRSIVRSEDIHRDWAGIAERIGRDLGIAWPSRSMDVDLEISRFVESGRREHERNTTSQEVPGLVLEWLNRTQTAVGKLRAGNPQEVEEATRDLEGVRLELGHVTAIVTAAVEGQEAQRSTPVSGHEDQLVLTTSQLQVVKALLLDTRSVMNDLRGQLAGSIAQRDRAESERIMHEAAMSEMRRQKDSLEGQVEHLETERARLAAEVLALTESKSWRITAPLRAVWGMLVSRARR